MRVISRMLVPLLLLFAVACSPQGPDTVAGARIALVVGDLAEGRTVALVSAADERATELGMELESFDAAGDPDRQKDLVAQAVENGFDGILVEPAAMLGYEGVFSKARSAGVPLAVVGVQNAAIDVAQAYIGPGATEQGRTQMLGVVEALGGRGRIAVLPTTMRTAPQVHTQLGYDDVLADHPGIDVVFSQPANGSPSQAAHMVESWLRQDDSLVAVVAMDDAMALGALAAARDAGREDVAVFGIGASDQMLGELLDGIPGGTLWASPRDTGRQAVDLMEPLILGVGHERETHVALEWVDRDNVSEYLHE